MLKKLDKCCFWGIVLFLFISCEKKETKEINKYIEEITIDDHAVESFISEYQTDDLQNFVFENDITDKDLINIISFAALKHHGIKGVNDLYRSLLKNPDVSSDFLSNFKFRFQTLLPDFSKMQKDLKFLNKNFQPKKSVSDYYDFEEYYALAKNILSWQDSDFWQATPRYLTFALIAQAKYRKSQNDIDYKNQTADGIHFLNSIKRLL